MKLLVLLGSTNQAGFNAKLVDAALADLPTGVEVDRFDLSTLPFYDEVADGEGRLGDAVTAYRQAVADADAILFASPAYNGTISAVGKNAIDTASRPRGAAPIVGKPVLVVSAVYSPGAEQRVIEHASTALRIAGAQPMERTFGLTHHFENVGADGLVDKDRERELQGLVADLLAPVNA